MNLKQFMKWKQKIILGASLRVVAPTGQYDPTKLVNWGINRSEFKPEFGYSQRLATGSSTAMSASGSTRPILLPSTSRPAAAKRGGLLAASKAILAMAFNDLDS